MGLRFVFFGELFSACCIASMLFECSEVHLVDQLLVVYVVTGWRGGPVCKTQLLARSGDLVVLTFQGEGTRWGAPRENRPASHLRDSQSYWIWIHVPGIVLCRGSARV